MKILWVAHRDPLNPKAGGAELIIREVGRRLAKKGIEVTVIAGEVINIGSTEEITVYELAEMIKRMTGSRSRIIFEKARENDPRRRAADTRKAENMFGWKPAVSLEDGLKRTIEWFRGRIR